MVKKMTPMNKALVQDWQSLALMDDDEPLIRVISQRKIAALVAMCEYLKWKTRYDSPPAQDTLDNFSAQTEYDLTNPIDLCELLEPCLTPIYDALAELQSDVTSIRETVESIQQKLTDSQTVQPPIPAEIEDCDPAKAYNGCLAAVEQVNLLITGIYKRAEVEAPDNFQEATELLLSAIPIFETLPLDELFSLVQWTFDNQKAEYEADYVEETEGHYWFERAAGQLWCLVKDDCMINHERIGMWLSSLADIYPDNYAAEIFTRFGNATEPTMVNQIGELLNSLRGGQSLAQFFDDIIVQFGVGAQTENTDYLWIDCPTGTYTATNVGIITECGTGPIETVEYENGVPFEMSGYLLAGSDTYCIALRLPVGNWQVELTGFVGSIVPPPDTNQTAYAYHNTSGILVNVKWNTPATPNDFGTQETNQAAFAPWCSTELFNAVLFNDAPFSVEFTVTALP